ncbi:unnamed protein product [Calypogeia fissa]
MPTADKGTGRVVLVSAFPAGGGSGAEKSKETGERREDEGGGPGGFDQKEKLMKSDREGIVSLPIINLVSWAGGIVKDSGDRLVPVLSCSRPSEASSGGIPVTSCRRFAAWFGRGQVPSSQRGGELGERCGEFSAAAGGGVSRAVAESDIKSSAVASRRFLRRDEPVVSSTWRSSCS